VGHQFHKTGRKVGDVRPENVFISEEGQVKVATRLTFPSENTNYHKTFYEKEVTYLAPEELRDIQFAKMEPSSNLQLAESFSIGLTCLDAGTLTSSANLYNKNKFNYDDLNGKRLSLKNAGYSPVLCMVIGNLCEPNFENRSTCSELYKWL
jgi:serine/threonine protein kinase